MPTKRKISLVVVFIVILTILGFWYVGSKDKKIQDLADQKRYTEIIKKDRQLKSLVASLVSGTSTLENFDPSDLPTRLKSSSLTKTTNATSSFQKYGLAITKTLEPFGAERENEARVMLRALDQQDETEAQKLLLTKEMYDRAVTSLIKIPVPTDLVITHLKLVNSLKTMSALLTNMSDVLRNPVVALQSADSYRQKQLLFYAAIKEINVQMEKRGINFTKEQKINIFINWE